MLILLPVNANNYRYGRLTWERSTGRTITFMSETIWQSTFSGNEGIISLDFGDGSSNTSVGQVIASDSMYRRIRNQWTHTYSSDGPFNVSFTGSGRPTINNGGASLPYRIWATVDLHFDDQHSPTVDVPSAVLNWWRSSEGSPIRVDLPAIDIDSGNGIQCRLATAAESQIPSNPTAGANNLIVAANCTFEYDDLPLLPHFVDGSLMPRLLVIFMLFRSLSQPHD